jgi:hypothetical protein
MRHQRLFTSVLLEGGECTDKNTAGCDALLFSQIGADVSEEPIASASAFCGLYYITPFFHVACSSTLNREAASSYWTFVQYLPTKLESFASPKTVDTSDTKWPKRYFRMAMFGD